MLSKKIGIALGTSRMLVYVKGEGVVVNEPALMATDEKGGRVLAVGTAAFELLGRGGRARAIRPVGDGNVVDYGVAATMLQYLINRIVGRQRIFRPDVVLSIAPQVTGVARRTVLEATMQAGARTAYLIDKPLAAAIGAKLPVATTDGVLVANLGAGSTEIAAIANGEVVAMESVPVGGRDLDQAIVTMVERREGVRLSPDTAERVKIEIGSATAPVDGGFVDVPAVDAAGHPRTIRVGATEAHAAIQDGLATIVEALMRVVREVPAERQRSLQRQGVVLTGGGAQLRGAAQYVAERSGLPARVAADPQACIALGTGMALDNLAVIRRGQHYIS